MKLIANKYPEETEVAKWLVFDSNEEGQILLVFARRLAALARDNKNKIYISEGYRSAERQKYFYDLYLSGKGNLAAKPGTSLHEFHIAADIGDPKSFWKMKSNNEWVPFSKFSQISLNKYGLCLPLNSKENRTTEWWHVTPIEYYRDYKGTLSTFVESDDKIMDWNLELKKTSDNQTIMNALKPYVSNPDYWLNVLEEKTEVNPNYLKQLIVNTFSNVDIINILINKNIITSREYWLNVLNNNSKCNVDYLRILLLKLLS